ncbi:MAG: hypothetical protein ACR2K3_13380 [Nocardioides sp.]
MTDDLLTLADALYALPLQRFTPERDAQAKAAKGDRERVAAIKALRKPSLAAWVVNLLVRREPAQLEQVLAVGAALREAQEGMDGAELRALTRQRRQLTSAVTQQARSLAGDEGVRVTQAVADQVEATLTAGLIDPEAARAVRSGLLVAALSATGVGSVDIASAVALPDALGFEASPTTAETPAPPVLHVVPDDGQARRREEAARALEEAEAALTEAGDELTRATSAVEELKARSLQVGAEIDELRRQLAELETAAEQTDDELTEASEALEEAEAVHADAVRAKDAAAARVR